MIRTETLPTISRQINGGLLDTKMKNSGFERLCLICYNTEQIEIVKLEKNTNIVLNNFIFPNNIDKSGQMKNPTFRFIFSR